MQVFGGAIDGSQQAKTVTTSTQKPNYLQYPKPESNILVETTI